MKMMLLKWACGALLAWVSCGLAAGADFTTERWRVAEIPLVSSVTYADPFQNVDVTATFTGPGGETIVRPGFWDGGNVWRVRFAPTVTGRWSMTTTCTDPANTGLQGITRTIQCDAYSGPYAIFQHGFLKPSANGHYFTYADGTPFFYLGDTHWLFIHERFDTSNIPGVPSQFKYTVDKRVAQGFTVFQTEAIHNPHGGTHLDPSEEAHADLRDGLTAADLPGFANIDRKCAYLADHGLVHASAGITWAAEPQTNAIYTEAYMTRLGRYWAARYGAYPVLWTVAQEIDPNFYNGYNTTTMGLWYAGAKAITDNDPYGQPLGAHMQSISDGINSPSESSWGTKPYHKWWPMQLQNDINANRWESTARDFYQNVPVKPVVLYESPYESFWTDAKGARYDGYRAFQTGMCGYGYGANGVWSDLYQLGDYGTDYFMPQGYIQWHDGANLPGGTQMSFLKQFYQSLNWWNLVPRFTDQAWATFPDPDHSLLTSDGNTTYVAYFFGDGSGTGTLKGLAAGTPYAVSWFNPRTGDTTSLGGIITASGQWNIPPRPTSDDWMLLVKQNPAAVVTTPALGSTVSPSLTRLSWAAAGAPAGISYEVYFGDASRYDTSQPHGNLARLTPPGGISDSSVALPSSLPAGNYAWVLAATDPASGTTRLYTSLFTIATSLALDGNFETPGPLSGATGWARVADGWNPAISSEFQQNNLTPAAGAHFTSTCPGGGSWYALLNGNIGSLTRDLNLTVNAGDTLSVTFYGGRAKAGASTAAGGVFNAAFLVGSTAYGTQVDTTLQANDSWQSYTLTKTFTNSGSVSLKFNAVSGNPWLDNIGNVSVTVPPELSVAIAAPLDGAQISTSAPVVATTAIANGTNPCTVTYLLSKGDGTAGISGTSSTPPYAVNFGTLLPGIWQIQATATDASTPPASAFSLVRTFKVAPVTTIPVQNGSFETPGTITNGDWAHLGAVWNPSVANAYQQGNLSYLPADHFSVTSPGGGVWYALLDGNIGAIRQDLPDTVAVGDTVSVTFYGGRSRANTSTGAGGIFNATFMVGSTAYSTQVDTTMLPNDSWKSFTLTKTVTNAGPLGLAFSAVNGHPWLDNISSVTVTPRSPFNGWMDGQPGVPSGGTGFYDDPNSDGLANGLVWILGGTSSLTGSQGRLPAPAVQPDGSLTLNFDYLNPADRGTESLAVEYGNSPGSWLSALVPDSDAVINGVTFTVSAGRPLHVRAVVPKVNPTDNRLFARLKAVTP